MIFALKSKFSTAAGAAIGALLLPLLFAQTAAMANTGDINFTTSHGTATTATIANGDALTIDFTGHNGTGPAGPIANQSASHYQKNLCLFKNGTRVNTGPGSTAQYGAGDTIPNSINVAAGVSDTNMNINATAFDVTYAYVQLFWSWTGTKVGYTCSELPSTLGQVNGFAYNGQTVNIVGTDSWTVTPAINSPITQTLYVGTNNTAAASVSFNHLGLVQDLSSGGQWSDRDPASCDPTSSATQTPIPTSLHLNTAVSANNAVPDLLLSGTPIPADIGTYSFCMRLRGTVSNYAIFNLTIAAALPVQNPVTTPAPVIQKPSPMVTGITGSGTNRVITGSLLGNITSAKVNGQPVKVITAANGQVEITVPELPAGEYSIELFGADGNVNWQNGLRIQGAPAVQQQQTPSASTQTKDVLGFGGDSASLTKSIKAAIKSSVAGAIEVQCVGATSNKKVTPADRKLALARAKAACAFVKAVSPSVTTSVDASPSIGIGSGARKVTLTVTK